MIDSHMHLKNRHPEAIWDVARQYGCTRIGVLSLSMKDDPLNNLSCLLVKALQPDSTYAFCGLVYGEDAMRTDALHQLQLWYAAGFDGWKILESKPNHAKRLGVRLDSKMYAAAFEWAENNSIPITWHVGDPATFWNPREAPDWAIRNGWAYLDGTYPALSELYAQTEAVLSRHPGLSVALAHLYFASDDEAHARRILDRFPNVRMDITQGGEMYFAFARDPDRWRRFFLEYADRLMYGTDLESDDECFREWPALWVRDYLTQPGEADLFGVPAKRMALPADVAHKILEANFLNYAGEKPRPLDARRARDACDWTISLLERRGDKKALEEARALAFAIREKLAD